MKKTRILALPIVLLSIETGWLRAKPELRSYFFVSQCDQKREVIDAATV